MNELLAKEIQSKTNSFLMGERIILFSGSFDPFHNGHLKLAKLTFNLFKANIVFTAFDKVFEKPNLSNIALRNEVIDQSIKKYAYFFRWNNNDQLNCDNAAQYLFNYKIYKLFGIDSFYSFLDKPCASNQLDLCNIIIHLRPGWNSVKLEEYLLKKPYKEVDTWLDNFKPIKQNNKVEKILFNQESKKYIYLLKPFETISSKMIRDHLKEQNYSETRKLMVNPKAAKIYIEKNNSL